MRQVFIFYFLGGILSILLAYNLYLLKPVAADGGVMAVIIESGKNFNSIVKELASAGLIRSETIFKIYSFISGSARHFQAGAYLLKPSYSTPEIIDLLRSGPPDIKVLIAEGKTLKEVDAELSAAGLIKRGALEKFDGRPLKKDYPFLVSVQSLEGFLFPDTYRFSPDLLVESAVRKFLDNFQRKAWPILEEREKRMGNSYKILILAALIEKEVPFHEDRLLVSGVLHNRLRIGMPLQVDAEPWTYKNYGLPPAPIANPGLSAIEAALNPAKTDYLYYLSDPKTKKTIFSETLEEHIRNKAKYLGEVFSNPRMILK